MRGCGRYGAGMSENLPDENPAAPDAATPAAAAPTTGDASAGATGAETAPAGTDTPPDRLSVDPNSPWFNGDALSRGVGIVFKGVERFNVEEYCISENWVRLSMPKSRDRKGNPLTMKLSGPVAPYFKDTAAKTATAADDGSAKEQAD